MMLVVGGRKSMMALGLSGMNLESSAVWVRSRKELLPMCSRCCNTLLWLVLVVVAGGRLLNY